MFQSRTLVDQIAYNLLSRPRGSDWQYFSRLCLLSAKITDVCTMPNLPIFLQIYFLCYFNCIAPTYKQNDKPNKYFTKYHKIMSKYINSSKVFLKKPIYLVAQTNVTLFNSKLLCERVCSSPASFKHCL